MRANGLRMRIESRNVDWRVRNLFGEKPEESERLSIDNVTPLSLLKRSKKENLCQ